MLPEHELAKIPSNSSNMEKIPKKRLLNLVRRNEGAKVLDLLPPGSFAKLDTQPNDLPPFQVINCKGGRCLVRQQSWGKYVHWEVEHHRLKSA